MIVVWTSAVPRGLASDVENNDQHGDKAEREFDPRECPDRLIHGQVEVSIEVKCAW